MVHEIAIIGGGFGGVRVAKILSSASRRRSQNIHITLIDKSRYHTFNPNLYEVATAYLPEVFGHLTPDFLDLKFSSIYPLEEMFLDDLNVTILEEEVVGIDLEKRNLKFKSGGQHEYDILVIGAGSETNYFDLPRLAEKAFPLKNFFHALSIRNAIDEVFANTPKERMIHIVIGGGGFSGCELSGELIGYAKKLAQIHGRPKSGFECLVIEAADTLLGGLSKATQEIVKKRLTKLGVKFNFGNPIKSVEEGNIILKDGSKIFYDVLVWTAGVRANELVERLSGVKLEKTFCMVADEFLRISPYGNVFGVGDIIYCVDEITKRPVPMTASNALREAKYIAENVQRYISKKPLLKYKAPHHGFIIPLGGKYAILESHGFRMTGIFPWVLKQLVALHYWTGLLGFRRALRIWRRGLEISGKND